MADRYDKPFQRRPNPVDGGSSRRADPVPPAEDDPLVELARIVSGNPSFDDIVGGRKPQSPPPPPVQPARPAAASQRPSHRDTSFDLESELLNDLQSSFDPVARSPAPRQAPPEPSVARSSFREPPMSRDAPVSRDPPPSREPPAPREPRELPPSRESREGFDHLRLRPGQPAAPARPSQPAGRFPEPPADDEDPYAGMAYSASPEFARSRPSENPPPRVAEGPIPRAITPQSRRAPEPPREEPPAYEDDETYYDDDAAAQGDYGDYADGERYDDGDGMEPEPPRRSRRALITVVVILAVVLLGGLAALALKGRSAVSGAGPQVITADEAPTKVQPAVQPQQDAGDQNKMIYDRANSDTPSQEQLVLPDDGPVDEKPPVNESEGSREISRIILPGAPGDAADGGANNAAAPAAPAPDANAAAPPDASAAPPDNAASAPDNGGGIDVGPRKVRTVVVRPDGTIVSSEAAPRGAAPDANADPSAAPNTLTAPSADPSSSAISAPAPSTPKPPAADASAPAPAAPQDVADASPAPALQKDPSQMAEPKPAAPKPAARQATADTGGAPAVSSGAAGGFVVQVTSQRTADAATAAYRNLQRKFPSVLGNRDPDIARADLGAKGVYYRARIGPMATRDEAANFCEQLKAAGGDCIVQKN